jgi:lysophospholipase L1-like esterase
MTRTKTLIFSLIPLLLILLVLEVVGRAVYPFDAEGRARVMAERDARRDIAPFSKYPNGQVILEDIYGMDKRYLTYLGWVGAPNTVQETVRTNALGFRDDPVDKRVPGETRILVLGGSAAWGWGASANEHTVVGAMQRVLNQGSRGPRYRVMSAAYLAWTSLQERIALMELYDQFDPDVVISLTGFNDVISVLYGNSRELLRAEYEMLQEAVQNNLTPMGTLTAIRKVGGTLGVWRLFVRLREEMLIHRGRQNRRVDYAADRAEYGIPKIVDRYVSMANYVRPRSGQYIVAMQPEIYTSKKALTVDEANVERWLADRNGENFTPTFARYRGELVRAVGDLTTCGVPVVDLRGVFDGLRAAVFVDDSHFNVEGYLAMAEALAEVVREQGRAGAPTICTVARAGVERPAGAPAGG